MYASGGWGPNERFVTPGEGKLADSLDFKKTRWHFHTQSGDYANSFETPCGTYANVNLDRYLIRFTGNPKYGDNMERVVINGMLAALPMQPDGRTFYYSDYHPGAVNNISRQRGPAVPALPGKHRRLSVRHLFSR